MKSSLESKTIRPGLLAYSSYHSDRHPGRRGPEPVVESKRGGRKLMSVLFLVVVGAGLVLGFKTVVSQQSNNVNPNAGAGAPAAAATSNHCASNSSPQFILVSISQRHLWACQLHKSVYDTPVVTGQEQLEADKTPVGTYRIYAKQADTTLTGSDATGQWSDPVQYWMPFLDNQFGTYGLHDATWRPESDFGHIDPNSNKGSHGCVELPLAASAWLYNWAQVGTTVQVEN